MQSGSPTCTGSTLLLGSTCILLLETPAGPSRAVFKGGGGGGGLSLVTQSLEGAEPKFCEVGEVRVNSILMSG